jgi:hypothetical protein
MEVVERVDTAAPAPTLFGYVADLSTYPEWLDLVVRAEPEPEPANAWSVELRGRIGPLARAKRLRMVRVEHAPPHRAVFERIEQDGKQHSPWVLSAEVTETDSGSSLTMRLNYGGGLFAPVIDRMLRDEIRRARRRLPEQVVVR